MVTRSILRGDVYWVNLDPTIGTEIQKKRPALVMGAMMTRGNAAFMSSGDTTSAGLAMGCRPELVFQKKNARVLLDQIRCVDKLRLGNRLGKIDAKVWHPVLMEMLA